MTPEQRAALDSLRAEKAQAGARAMPGGPTAGMPPSARAAPPMLSAPTPGSAVAVSTRPNFTMPPPTPPSAATDVPFRTTGGNPNVPAGGSAEAQGFRAEQQRFSGPQRPAGAAPATSPLRGVSEGVRGAVGSLPSSVRSVVNSGAGKLVGGLAIGDAMLDSAAPDSTARYAKRFAMDEPTGDGSVGDVAKFAGLRTLGFFSDLGNSLTGGLAGRLYQDNDMPAAQPAAAVPTTTAPADGGGNGVRGSGYDDPRLVNADPARASLGSSRDYTGELAAVPTQMPNGLRDSVIHKTLDTNGRPVYTGTNVKEGAQMVDGMGRAATRQPPSLGVYPGTQLSPGAAPNLPVSQSVGDGGSTVGQGAIGIGGDTLSSSSARDFQSKVGQGSTLDRFGVGPATRNQIMEQDARQRGIETQEAGQNARAAASNNVSLRGQDRSSVAAQIAADASRANADLAAAVNVRGQDINDRRASATDKRAAMQQDRQFQLDVTRLGADQAKTNFDQRERGQKSFDDWAGSIFTRKDDKGNDVQDTGKRAEFVRTSSAAVGRMIEALELKGDKQSLAYAQRLSTNGLGALDAEDKANLKTLFDRRQRHIDAGGQTSGFGPTGGVTDNLLDYSITGQDNGAIQKRLKTAGGQSIGVNDLRYTEPANRYLPDWFKTPTADLGPTAKERAALNGVR